MHSFRLIIEIDHGIFHAHQIMKLLKNTAEHFCSDEFFFPVNMGNLLNAVLPCFRWKNKIRSLHILTPVSNILADFVLTLTAWEWSGNTSREFILHTPAIDPFTARNDISEIDRKQRIIDPFLIFILFYKTVRMTALNCFHKIFTNCKHKKRLLYLCPYVYKVSNIASRFSRFALSMQALVSKIYPPPGAQISMSFFVSSITCCFVPCSRI